MNLANYLYPQISPRPPHPQSFLQGRNTTRKRKHQHTSIYSDIWYHPVWERSGNRNDVVGGVKEWDRLWSTVDRFSQPWQVPPLPLTRDHSLRTSPISPISLGLSLPTPSQPSSGRLLQISPNLPISPRLWQLLEEVAPTPISVTLGRSINNCLAT